MDSLPLLCREFLCPQVYPQLFFALRTAAVVPLGRSGYFSFRFLPLVVFPLPQDPEQRLQSITFPHLLLMRVGL